MHRQSLVLVISIFLLIAAFQPQAEAQPSPTATPSASSTLSASKAVPNAQPTKAPPNQETKLKTVVVTATRVEQPIEQIGTTVTVVGDQQMETQKIQDVGTALEQVPGVNVTQTGSPGTDTEVSIRGASPSQTLMLIDGVEVNAGTTGAFNIANLTTDNLN